jgi:hypothetical protein
MAFVMRNSVPVVPETTLIITSPLRLVIFLVIVKRIHIPLHILICIFVFRVIIPVVILVIAVLVRLVFWL